MTPSFLLNDFYNIISQTAEAGKLSATIALNPGHNIFKGHFEQMPVVPGVCQTQIIKEILQQHTQHHLQLLSGDNIKFMGMIVPSQNPVVNLEIVYKKEENIYLAEAKLFFENTTFTKFKGSFTAIE